MYKRTLLRAKIEKSNDYNILMDCNDLILSYIKSDIDDGDVTIEKLIEVLNRPYLLLKISFTFSS